VADVKQTSRDGGARKRRFGPKTIKFAAMLFGLSKIIPLVARRDAALRAHLLSGRGVVQIGLKDRSHGRHFVFAEGRVSSKSGFHPAPDVSMIFKDIDVALKLMAQPLDTRDSVHAAKNFLVTVEGPDELVSWFMKLAAMLPQAGLRHGIPLKDGSRRFTTMTNGGPAHVTVKDGRILRVHPITFGTEDAPSWTIEARGRSFSPVRKATVAPHTLPLKSLVYSENRLLHPMRRVDFDPNGERNPQNRGTSDYVRISWDEALDIVAGEILRMKREHGPGAFCINHGSHHQWGNVGYYLSALMRFGNCVGFTRVHTNPDSWEGWYWGASHHFGNSMRLGNPAAYGTLEDCLEACELIVYWSSDPESQFGAYGGQEGAQRRLWAKELGIETIHINPHLCPTAAFVGGTWIPVRPGGDNALAIAIMHVWMTEGLYDRDYVANRTTGFDEWRAYVLGEVDGVPKTPEWQETETGVPARDVRALARKWGRKKTYLAAGTGGAGFGGACRAPTGLQWARAMILLMAMQGWGRPGVNFGNLQHGSPVDLEFYFPGYAEGGLSGDLAWTAAAPNNYLRMPHILSMNPVQQMIPRQRFPEAILEGKAYGYVMDGTSLEAQFRRFEYPAPGYSKVHMLYRYGSSSMGTITNSNRVARMYRSAELECVVNQSIWFEGEARFADVILPACTQLERWDIGEWANSAAFGHHHQNQVNHRVVALQHKCIEPLGESKSDYQIFWDVCSRLGLGAYFSEGNTELDWCKRVFESSDLPKHISWKDFLRKGYFVVPSEYEPEKRTAVDMRWFAEGRVKDLPEPHPLPGANSGKFGRDLQTQSGKIEFVASSLKRFDAESRDRPPMNVYTPSWEGPAATELHARFPLQLITPHARFSFHTMQDGKDGFVNDVKDHRIEIDGWYYWIVRINPVDAVARGIGQHDLVKVHNDRGAVICAADVTETMVPGVVHSYESSAVYAPLGRPGESVDRGGCMNLLTSDRRQFEKGEAMAASACLVEVETWHADGSESKVQAASLELEEAGQ
jgi:molybdopterin guanine dinucleotide-containing S/N-oxide reductase-like protein